MVERLSVALGEAHEDETCQPVRVHDYLSLQQHPYQIGTQLLIPAFTVEEVSIECELK